ncbi:hypothetical protein CDL12_24322 [Handroanthus impetiginosus]|uniref:Uncharacterized protein n=1 Tax=Handroanthus impetiginosus TaxID=429701 RepID=A0A2G9GCY6_9LAMI|nr:hypothetical protein CDL12_24322 [Handroanthus impetiginosus]
METSSSEEVNISCWGRFILMFSQRRKLKNVTRRKRGRKSSACAFKYSPLSYSQNFDDGHDWEMDGHDSPYHAFSSRYVARFSAEATKNTPEV